MQRRVVVTGLGVVSPVGTGVSEAWRTILAGKSGITKLIGEEYAALPCKVAGFAQKQGSRIDLTTFFKKSELKTMAPATGFALIAAEEAIEDAKLVDLAEDDKQNIGVAVGMGMVDLGDICNTYENLKKAIIM